MSGPDDMHEEMRSSSCIGLITHANPSSGRASGTRAVDNVLKGAGVGFAILGAQGGIPFVAAISKVGLWKSIRGQGGLGAAIDKLDWSYGEKQLLALAQALTTPSPLLILDERTSSVDWETETQILEIIEQECAARTVIAVAHRLRHIERFDTVALLQHGGLVAFDSPGALLGRDSEFRKLYTASQKSGF
ncbi:ABC transporter integral membrane type 1 [Penicillium cf. griseofulvum]|uniref:ABC transporter integral membrane type 1 n=1 Tax=Penicillium cf. griseofulvum TaxID=2972120 RepID=A0A9W9JSP6_9EURO|nr:ABC transporter integral membrane type 1 [Penicillium cf. griseofulvum]KAJ5451116.1 ABC transporter integral membrane type 1 [Penicillium cf. griseofulvum]